MATVHLHRDDVPDTLALLNALVGDRTHPVPGYTPDETGAAVDWEELLASWLSTSEKRWCTLPAAVASWNATAVDCPSNSVGKSRRLSNPPPRADA